MKIFPPGSDVMITYLACSILLLVAGDEKPNTAGYAKPELLIEAAELAKPQAARGRRILDARGKSKYTEGHIPDAVWVDHTAWMRSFDASDDKDAWAKRIGGQGIDLDTPVVIYDDSGFKDAGRIWWILCYWGVRDVRLLNGGWKAWLESKGLISTEKPQVTAVDVKLAPISERMATKVDVLAAIKKGQSQIVDARSTGEFCGTEQTAKRNGAIPGAKHLEWSDAIDPKTKRYKSAEELKELFKEAGIDPSRPSITYCQSGGRASVMAFTLELMGGKEVRNYYKSWAEWGNDDATPIERGKK
jgi:thiosulfate/3-mercaptopyruvate sulfurtransferase